MQLADVRADASSDLSFLPPLPQPDYALRKIETRRGFSVVFGLISVFVVLTHGVGLTVGDLPDAGWWFCFALIYGEAAIATLCYFLMMLGDAGVVRRTPETCLPVPPEVAERLRAGAPVPETLRNINSDDGTRTYCVRCFVWRPAGLQGRGRPHHCRVCQRCVLHFDHHCGVYGRCIAGDGVRNGNLRYFFTIIIMGYAGFFTMLATCVAGLAFRWAATPDEAGSGG